MIDSLIFTLKSRNCLLKSIDLSNNYITDQGAIKLVDFVKMNSNTNLQRINLIGNHINE